MCWPAAFDWARSDIGINPPPGTGYFIRGMPLGLSVNGFIGDASPLGEVFVATIEQERGGLRPVEVERHAPNARDSTAYRQLIAALWF